MRQPQSTCPGFAVEIHPIRPPYIESGNLIALVTSQKDVDNFQQETSHALRAPAGIIITFKFPSEPANIHGGGIISLPIVYN